MRYKDRSCDYGVHSNTTYIAVSFHVLKELLEELDREGHILSPEVSQRDKGGGDEGYERLVLLDVYVPSHQQIHGVLLHTHTTHTSYIHTGFTITC